MLDTGYGFIGISIHALREEGDRSPLYLGEATERISIHALREEGDAVRVLPQPISKRFLSTPSARRATDLCLGQVARLGISIHALREEGDAVSDDENSRTFISIHALREEGDARTGSVGGCGVNFYPRPPRGGRPVDVNATGYSDDISIHALREEGDVRWSA